MFPRTIPTHATSLAGSVNSQRTNRMIKGRVLMPLCQTRVPKFLSLYLGLFLLASIPAVSQSTLGIDLGQTKDKFGSLSSNSALIAILDGRFTILHGNGKEGAPNVVIGGEVRYPEDTSTHARELAAFGGPEFQFGNFTVGFHGQVRKIYVPSSQVDSLTFVRNNMLLLELPAIAEYRFGPAHHAFVRAEGIWEFNPHYSKSSNGTATFPNPKLDHGYTIRGSAGYNFHRWYLKATYESRYFKFSQNGVNPEGLDNWRSDQATGGIGFVF